jgi:hypothetical protein
MINEKIEAGFALQALALTGGLGVTADSAATNTGFRGFPDVVE